MVERELPPLYDPRFEHDACGVGFVVDMKGRKSHAIVDQALTAVCCLNHRGAAGAEPDTGDGAGILVQMPDAFYRAVGRFRASRRGRVRDRYRVRARRPGRCHHRRGREGSRRRGLRGARLARGSRRAQLPRRIGPRADARVRAGVRRQERARRRRARTARVPRAQAHRARDRRVLRVAQRSRRRLQGHAHARPARRVLRRPARRTLRERARARALALQHEHVPELAARAPVPDARAQRRDQHGAGQRELDARPRRCDGERRAARRPRARVPDLHARAPPTPHASTRRSSCSTSRAVRCTTRSS